MKRHIAVTLLAGLLLASAAAAAPPINGGFGCFGPTVGIGDFSGLDNALAAGGITQKLGSLQWGFGGAGFALIDRVVIGGSGWGSSQTVGSESLRATIEIAGGEFDLGYQVYSMEHLLVAAGTLSNCKRSPASPGPLVSCWRTRAGPAESLSRASLSPRS